MDAKKSKRCPHYQLFSEPLGLEGPPAYLAIRRCLLAERLVALLRPTEQGSLLTDKLQVQADNRKFAVVGPDLEAVTQSSCTVERCDTRCTPAYKQHLQHFGVTDPREDSVTCDEEAAEAEASVKEIADTRPASPSFLSWNNEVLSAF